MIWLAEIKSSSRSVIFQIQANLGDNKKKKICLSAASPVWSNAVSMFCIIFKWIPDKLDSLSFLQVSTVQTDELIRRQKNNLNLKKM